MPLARGVPHDGLEVGSGGPGPPAKIPSRVPPASLHTRSVTFVRPDRADFTGTLRED